MEPAQQQVALVFQQGWWVFHGAATEFQNHSHIQYYTHTTLHFLDDGNITGTYAELTYDTDTNFYSIGNKHQVVTGAWSNSSAWFDMEWNGTLFRYSGSLQGRVMSGLWNTADALPASLLAPKDLATDGGRFAFVSKNFVPDPAAFNELAIDVKGISDATSVLLGQVTPVHNHSVSSTPEQACAPRNKQTGMLGLLLRTLTRPITAFSHFSQAVRAGATRMTSNGDPSFNTGTGMRVPLQPGILVLTDDGSGGYASTLTLQLLADGGLLGSFLDHTDKQSSPIFGGAWTAVGAIHFLLDWHGSLFTYCGSMTDGQKYKGTWIGAVYHEAPVGQGCAFTYTLQLNPNTEATGGAVSFAGTTSRLRGVVLVGTTVHRCQLRMSTKEGGLVQGMLLLGGASKKVTGSWTDGQAEVSLTIADEAGPQTWRCRVVGSTLHGYLGNPCGGFTDAQGAMHFQVDTRALPQGSRNEGTALRAGVYLFEGEATGNNSYAYPTEVSLALLPDGGVVGEQSEVRTCAYGGRPSFIADGHWSESGNLTFMLMYGARNYAYEGTMSGPGGQLEGTWRVMGADSGACMQSVEQGVFLYSEVAFGELSSTTLQGSTQEDLVAAMQGRSVPSPRQQPESSTRETEGAVGSAEAGIEEDRLLKPRPQLLLPDSAVLKMQGDAGSDEAGATQGTQPVDTTGLQPATPVPSSPATQFEPPAHSSEQGQALKDGQDGMVEGEGASCKAASSPQLHRDDSWEVVEMAGMTEEAPQVLPPAPFTIIDLQGKEISISGDLKLEAQHCVLRNATLRLQKGGRLLVPGPVVMLDGINIVGEGPVLVSMGSLLLRNCHLNNFMQGPGRPCLQVCNSGQVMMRGTVLGCGLLVSGGMCNVIGRGSSVQGMTTVLNGASLMLDPLDPGTEALVNIPCEPQVCEAAAQQAEQTAEPECCSC